MLWSALDYCRTVYSVWILASRRRSPPAITPISFTCNKFARHQLVQRFPQGQMCVCVWCLRAVCIWVCVCACTPITPSVRSDRPGFIYQSPDGDWLKKGHMTYCETTWRTRGCDSWRNISFPFRSHIPLSSSFTHTRGCTKPRLREGPYIEVEYSGDLKRWEFISFPAAFQ